MNTALAHLNKLLCTLSLFAVGACGGDPEPAPVTSGGAAGTSAAGVAGTAGSTSGGAGGTSAGGTSAGGTSAAGTGGSAGSGGSAAGSAGASAAGSAGTSSGGSGGAAPGTPTFTQVTKILQDNCGSKCHSATAEDKLNLTSTDPAGLYTRLTAPIDLNLCYMERAVEPGYASISLLAKVIKGAVDKPCPLPRMPYGCETSNSCLSDADIAIIDGWINAGAFQN